MPGIDRRRPCDRLIAAGKMRDVVVECSVRRERADIEFVDRISHAIALVSRAVRSRRYLKTPSSRCGGSAPESSTKPASESTVPPLPSVMFPAETSAMCPWSCPRRKARVRPSRTAPHIASHMDPPTRCESRSRRSSCPDRSSPTADAANHLLR